jgi:hypothetical protein
LQRQRQTLEGLLARRSRASVLKVHQDAQRLLKPLLVANPYAEKLTFLDDRTRTRRDHVKYLTLIRTIALLHQHQRPVKTTIHGGVAVPYIEVTREDIAVANNLAHQALGRSLDELPPQTRRLLLALDAMVDEVCSQEGLKRSDFRFSRRLIRERLGWTSNQIHVHLSRLVELEYVIPHRGRRGQTFEYELAYDGLGKDGSPFLSGLLDIETLKGTTSSVGGQKASIGGRFAPKSGHLGVPPTTLTSLKDHDFIPPEEARAENAHLEHTFQEPS